MTCDVRKCQRPSYLGYEAFKRTNRCVGVCEWHWRKHCDDNDKFDLRTHFYPKR